MKDRIYEDIKWIISSLAGSVVKLFKWALGLLVILTVAVLAILFVLIGSLL